MSHVLHSNIKCKILCVTFSIVYIVRFLFLLPHDGLSVKAKSAGSRTLDERIFAFILTFVAVRIGNNFSLK